MAFITTNTPPDPADAPRERLSRLLAVAGFLYALIAGLAAVAAAVGLFGLAGVQPDPGAAQAAQMLGLPWSLAAGDPAVDGAGGTLLVTIGALALNLMILVVAARLAHGRLRGA